MTSLANQSHRRMKPRENNDTLGLMSPAEMFACPLPRPFVINAHLPFQERVERALARLMTGFEEDEYERLRAALVEAIDAERNRGQSNPCPTASHR